LKDLINRNIKSTSYSKAIEMRPGEKGSSSSRPPLHFYNISTSSLKA